MGVDGSIYRVQGLGFRYPEKEVLRGLSFRLEKGRFYGLLGPNGCGKTTLIDLLARLRPSTEGRIEFLGRSLSDIPRRQLAREVALVPQDFYINFPFTAREIIMMGRYPHMPRFTPPSAADVEIVERVLDETGTRSLSEQRVTALSGGERQRVVFARALAQGAPVLLLDEATSNLDIRYAIHLLNLTVQQVRERQHTVMAVFQDINLAAMYCDALFFMSRGRIVEAGSVGDVLTADTIGRVFGVDCRVQQDNGTGNLQVIYRR